MMSLRGCIGFGYTLQITCVICDLRVVMSNVLGEVTTYTFTCLSIFSASDFKSQVKVISCSCKLD